jgi:peptide deformylase
VNNKTNQNINNNNNNNNNNIRRSSKVVANARKGMLFNSEMDDIRRDAKPAEPVKFTLPLSIKLYPSKCLRAENEPVTVFDDNLKELSKEMFKIMYETVGCGLAAPQVGVNYRLMVYNEAGAPGEGKEVVLVNPKISKFSKQKDFFEEGCLSFPKIYAEVEVRVIVVSSFLFSFVSITLLSLRVRVRVREGVWKTKTADERSKHKYTLIRVSFNREAVRRNVS